MRIALVSMHVGAHTNAFAQALATEHDVVIYTRKENSQNPEREIISGSLEIVRIPAGPAKPLPEPELLKLVPDFGTALADAWAANPPDVAHSQSWLSGLAALVARENRSIPIAHTSHGLISAWLRHVQPAGADADPAVAERTRLERAIAHDVDHLIVTSRAELGDLRAIGVRTSKATVIPSGVDLDHFKLAGDQALDGTNRPRLLMLEGLAPYHGADNMVTALQGVPDAELVIAGGPPAGQLKHDEAANRIRALADQCGVGDRIRLLGAVPYDELPELIRSADAVVSVPWYEPTGTAALQGMACGRAVIATAVGALSDVVIPGTTGVFVPPRNPRRLAAAVRGLLSDPLRLEGYGLAGRERAEFRHGWSRIAAETAHAYQELKPLDTLDIV